MSTQKIVKTYIAAAKIENLLLSKGYIFLEDKSPVPEGYTGRAALIQKGFIKVPGAKGRAIYVAKTQEVGRIDVSGFESETPGLVNLGDDSFGAVKQQVNMGLPEDEILLNLELLIDHMFTLEPVVKATKEKKSKEATEKAQGWSFVPVLSAEEKVAAKAAREALLAKVASEMGVEISERA